ncbi:MAG: methyltransferase domain-containing protein [Chloroflexi bacterium]|nr:methyltransferase domain-containing protein [Chloroflexota bacterium]
MEGGPFPKGDTFSIRLFQQSPKETFDRIAPGWYSFRHWTIFRRELESLAKRWQGGRLLNAGCGHGADFLPFKDKFDLYGVDFSIEMLKLARKYSEKFDFLVSLTLADVGHLPFVDSAFDHAISVATYHHVKGKEARLSALSELRRVLKPGGEALITVWNRWQPRFWLKGKEVAVPWRTKDETLYRYYYLFSYHELETLAKQAGFQVLRSFPESSYHFPIKSFSRNICLLLKK